MCWLRCVKQTIPTRCHPESLVSREPSPTDRRSVRVALTAEGLAAVDAAMVDLLAAEQSILADLAPAEREALATLLRRVVLPFESGNAAG